METALDKSKETWVGIVEGQFEDLIQLKATLLGSSEEHERDRQLQYIDVLLADLRRDAGELRGFVASLQHPDLRLLAQTILWIRTRDLSKMDELVLLEQQANTIENRILRGEFYFLLGTANNGAKNFRKASDFFLAATGILETCRAHKKSLIAMLGYVSAYSGEFPNARLFSELTGIFKSATQLQMQSIAATALMNISKEFQLLEAFAVSLDYAVQAEDLFVKHAPGSRDHGFCLLQKASVLSQMQKSGESLKALQQALNSKHSEVLSRAQLMADQSGVPLISEDSLQLREDSGQRVLGELEGKLVALLAEGPKDKAVLMKALYGEKICSQARENRFKNLMSRVRAKLPGLVVLKNSNYEIIDVSAIGDKLISQRSAN